MMWIRLRIFCVRMFMLGFLAMPMTAFSAVIFEHTGDNDPQTEGWTKDGTSGFADATGKPNWRLKYGKGSNFYRIIGTLPPNGTSVIEQAYSDPNGWTATAEIHLLAAAEINEATFVAQDAINHFHVRFYDGTGGQPVGAYAYWQSAIPEVQIGTVDPTDGFHTYQIVLDAKNDSNFRNDEIFYYIDGVQEYSVLRSDLPATPDRAEIIVGRFGVAGGNTDMLSSIWRLETGQHPIDPIDPPDPPGGAIIAWNVDNDGDWNASVNWDLNEVPNSREVGALFGDVITSDVTVNVITPVTVNGIEFDNVHRYTLAGSGSVNLAASSAPTLPVVKVTSGNHSLVPQLNLVDDTLVDVASGSTLATEVVELDGKTLTKKGDGRLDVNDAATGMFGSVVVEAGALGGSGTVGGGVDVQGGAVAPGNGVGVLNVTGSYTQSNSSTLQIEIAGEGAAGDPNGYDQLNVTSGATLDGTLEVSASGFSGTRGQEYTIAVVTAESLSGTFSNEPTAGTHLGFGLFAGDGIGGAVVAYDGTSANFTYLAAAQGDANGDRKVDITDFNILSSNFDPTGAQAGTNDWTFADFDHDGDIDITDFNGLSANFAPGGYGTLANQVPEPSSWLLLAACVLLTSFVCGRRLP